MAAANVPFRTEHAHVKRFNAIDEDLLRNLFPVFVKKPAAVMSHGTAPTAHIFPPSEQSSRRKARISRRKKLRLNPLFCANQYFYPPPSRKVKNRNRFWRRLEDSNKLDISITSILHPQSATYIFSSGQCPHRSGARAFHLSLSS